MLCPKCNSELAQSERLGIEIDYCPNGHGVWLDRGELEKIIERSDDDYWEDDDDDDDDSGEFVIDDSPEKAKRGHLTQSQSKQKSKSKPEPLKLRSVLHEILDIFD